ncbi:MAG TPA: tetratricopeptide repeat protein, partial [Fimbriiglobus sp.]|nr:tetratricopeptide repeat protein [Fimbriiglobus sp.]
HHLLSTMTIRLLPALALAGLLTAASSAQPPAASDAKAKELFKTGKFDDALKELRALAKADPKLPPARVTLADWFFQAGQGQPARLNLEAAAAEDPYHPSVYLLNGSFAFGEGRVTDCILSCKTVLQLIADPRWDKAQRDRYEREARTGLARSYEVRGDWTSAQDQLTEILKDDDKNGPARQRLATCLFRLGKPDAAFAELRKAHDVDPASELPELRMAGLANDPKDPTKAEEWLKKAVANHPKSADAVRTYSGWLLDAGRIDEAQKYLDLTVKLDPDSRETRAVQGIMARYRKDLPGAEKVFEELNRKHPNYPLAAWNLALVLADSGDKEKQRRAVEVAQAEVSRNQKLAEGFAVLGWALYKAGRLDDAEKALAPLVQPGVGVPSRDAAYFLARVLADKGRFEDARKALQAAESAKGGYVYRDEAQKLMAEVEKKIPPPKKDEKKK